MAGAAQDCREVDVGEGPVMGTVADLIGAFTPGTLLVLRASGGAIPNAVAAANILTESAGARTGRISVDTQGPVGIGMGVSTIRIPVSRD